MGTQRGVAGAADVPRALIALWGAAEGTAVGGFVLQFVLIVTSAAVALIALAFASGVCLRYWAGRLYWAGRRLLTGALACPVTTGPAIGSWIYVG